MMVACQGQEQTNLNYEIGLKALIISSDPALAVLPKHFYDSLGGDYNLLNVTQLESFTLANGATIERLTKKS
eukprot:Awhi_evm1s11822